MNRLFAAIGFGIILSLVTGPSTGPCSDAVVQCNANAILFDRIVVDTAQADPVLPDRAVRGVPGVQDLAGEPWRLISGRR